MDNIIDIEALSRIPVTRELAELLFEDTTNPYGFIGVDFDSESVTFTHSNRDVIFLSDGTIIQTNDNGCFNNAFQIVRYIDNYLNSLKEK